MSGSSDDSELERRRRRRLLGGLALGVAAVGIPALLNRLIARRAPRLFGPSWGETRRFSWGKGEVQLRDLGEGPPIVLLHGLGVGRDGEEWRAVAQSLSRRFRVVVPDLPGWGLSADPRLRYSVELYPAFVRDLVVDCVGEPPLLVGAGHLAAASVHALLGAGVAAAGLAAVCPRGVGGRVLQGGAIDALIRLVLPLPILGESALNGITSRASIARQLARDLYRAPERVDAGVVEHAYRAQHRPGAQRALGALLAGRFEDEVADSLERLDLPVLLLWGRHSRHPGIELADAWLAHLPDGELEVFEQSAALPHVEEAPSFARRLGAFADRVFDTLDG